MVFIHNNERNARLTAELMHDHCAYNLAIISPDAASRRITLPGHRGTVDPNELFTPDIADRCVRDEQACHDFVTNNAGARDNRTIDRVVRTQFFLAIQDCSAGFSLPVIALHNNAREDTAAYSRTLANQRRAGRNPADLRMDVDKTGATEGNQTVAEMLRRLRTRFGADVQRGLTERAGSTNIFRWCASNDLSRCHIGDPDRPDNVIWTTNARDFEALSHTNVNVALQSQLPPGPGSESSSDLSTLFIVLRALTPPSLQLLLDAIQHQRAIDDAELRIALQEIGRMNPATMGDAAARAIAELLQIADGVLRQGQLVADRLSRLRYVNIETPGLPLADQSDAERVANYQFISGALSTLGLDCCGPDPAAAHSRIESGLRAPSAH